MDRLEYEAEVVGRPAERPAFQALPHISIGELTGFIEWLHTLGDREDLYELARDLHMQAADLLGFGDLQEGDVLLTPEGVRFAEAGVLEEKEVFRGQAMANIELLRRIDRALHAAPDHHMREDALLEELEQAFSPEEAHKQLDTAIDWGRYAELFSYADAGEFSLEDESVTRQAG